MFIPAALSLSPMWAPSENISGHGAYIDNTASTGASRGGHKVNPRNCLLRFQRQHLNGIYITSYGAVSVGNVTANENGNYGLNIQRNVGTGMISVTRATFDHNTYGGIRIYTTPFGVTLTDVSASYNGTSPIEVEKDSGVYIE